mgnify:CR=1 FL=1
MPVRTLPSVHLRSQNLLIRTAGIPLNVPVHRCHHHVHLRTERHRCLLLQLRLCHLHTASQCLLLYGFRRKLPLLPQTLLPFDSAAVVSADVVSAAVVAAVVCVDAELPHPVDIRLSAAAKIKLSTASYNKVPPCE